jgi:hypothetical protein
VAYPHEDVAAAIADASRFAFSSAFPQHTKAFAVAASEYQDVAYVPPPTHVAPSVDATTNISVAVAGAIVVHSATSTAAGAIVVDLAPTFPTSDCQQNTAPSNAPPLDWGEVYTFDVLAHLNMEANALPLCFTSEEENCSDNNSVFIDLSSD